MIHTIWGASLFSFIFFFGIGMFLLAAAYIIRFWKTIKSDRFLRYLLIGFVTGEALMALCVSYIVLQYGWNWLLWQWGTGLALASTALIGVYLVGRWASRKYGDPMKYLEG